MVIVGAISHLIKSQVALVCVVFTAAEFSRQHFPMSKNELGLCEREAVAFFGSEHKSRANGTDWFDSNSVYEVSDQSGLTLTCAIHPIHRDARIRLLPHYSALNFEAAA